MVIMHVAIATAIPTAAYDESMEYAWTSTVKKYYSAGRNDQRCPSTKVNIDPEATTPSESKMRAESDSSNQVPSDAKVSVSTTKDDVRASGNLHRLENQESNVAAPRIGEGENENSSMTTVQRGTEKEPHVVISKGIQYVDEALLPANTYPRIFEELSFLTVSRTAHCWN